MISQFSLLQFALLLGVVGVCVRPLGTHIARVMCGERVWLTPVLGRLEALIYRAAMVSPRQEMGWKEYTASVLWLSLVSFLCLFAMLVGQGLLPYNPRHLPGLSWDLAFNVAASFITNTNWQSYGGEQVLSPFVQMAGLVVQHFISAAAGIAVAVVLFRGLRRAHSDTIGNFWADLTRATLYILLPLSLLLALALASQGVVQTFTENVEVTTLESKTQTIVMGPVASQIAIKQLGSNGGGYYNANSAHPLENPTPLSHFLELVAILLLPAAMAYAFGAMAGDTRQGWVVLAAMVIIFIPLAWAAMAIEEAGNPLLQSLVGNVANMEGKETRFGAGMSGLWAVATTATANGSVNAMHDSFMPLAGMISLLLMQLGEVVFGGVGCGIYTMLVYVLVTVFITGLMVGRTPEYMGKKLGAFEIKMASLVILIPSALAVMGAALAVVTEIGRAGISNPGPHGLTQVLYAVNSAANNNGSAFAGLDANSVFYNMLLGVIMLIGRFGVMLPVLAIAGVLAAKNTVPANAGTLPTHTPLFAGVLVGVVMLFGVLTHVPSLALGPVVEQLTLSAAARAKP